MTHAPHLDGAQPLAAPRPGRRALFALLLGFAALLSPRGFAEEAPAAPAPAQPAAPAAATPAPGPLCFTAESDGATVALQASDHAVKVALEISTDGKTWQEWKEPREAKLALGFLALESGQALLDLGGRSARRGVREAL